MMEKANLKVVPIRSARRPSDPEVIEVLERLLEQAKAGDLKAVAVAGICADDDVIAAAVNVRGDVFKMVGVVESLKFRLCSEFIES